MLMSQFAFFLRCEYNPVCDYDLVSWGIVHARLLLAVLLANVVIVRMK